MFLHTNSHRSSGNVDRAIGRHPQHFYRLDNRKGGVYFRLDDPTEIARAIAAGAKSCREQAPEGYYMCWRMEGQP